MHPHDQDLFIVGTVENTYLAPLRQASHGTPQEIMVDLFRTRMFETVYLATLWIHAGHNMAYRAILACRIHCLENQ